MQKSIWENTSEICTHKELNREIKTDVLIIGGGLCGILCAYFLKNAGIDCVLVDGNTIASGITKNTTAKITSQHGLIYSNLLKKKGMRKTQLYLKAHESAIAGYEKLCKNINCDFKKSRSFVYSRYDRNKIENEMNALNQIGFNASFAEEIELPFKIAGAVCFENQAQFNPLKFISEICKGLNIKGLNIYENTFVYELLKDKAITSNSTIKYDTAIVATHFPFINKHGSYFIKLYQERAYISAFKNAQTLNDMYLDESNDGFSFRSYNDTLLIGGSSHRTGKHSLAWEPLNAFAKKHYPHSELVCQWAAQDCMSLDHIAYIGQYSKRTPNLYVATGFNKWGMTSSLLSATILTDLINGKENEFADLFSPQRSIMTSQLATNISEAACNLIAPTKKRCPHLGCALKWNKNEHTWDCPCHGSRFESNGHLLDNPATDNLK